MRSAFRARATWLQKAPIGAGRRRYAEYIEGLRSETRSKVIISNLTVGGTYETNCRGGQATNGLQVPTNALTEGG